MPALPARDRALLPGVERHTRTSVERALTLIAAGALDAPRGTAGGAPAGVAALAGRLGMGARHLARHLARLFDAHLGASPRQVAHTLRVQRAKRRLDATDLPIPEVARRAGFPSARRMAAAFAALYGRPPSAVRRPRRPRPRGAVGA